MFKYISEILSKFTLGQRILALIILVVAIITISIGPKIIDSLTYDDTELTQKIESQKIEIKTLDSTVYNLNKQVIKNQKNCTEEIINNQKKCSDEAIKREKEIMEIINNIEDYIKNKKYPQPIYLKKVTKSNTEKNEESVVLPPKEDEILTNMIIDLKKKVSLKK